MIRRQPVLVSRAARFLHGPKRGAKTRIGTSARYAVIIRSVAPGLRREQRRNWLRRKAKECSEHAMKCLICGRFSLPGAKLCLDCKAARKRAFDATVTQPLLTAAGAARGSAAPALLKPSQSVPDAARRAAKAALAAQAQSKIIATESPRRAGRWPIIVGAMCIAVLAVGYFGHWFGAGKSATFAAVPVERPATQDSPTASSIVRASTPSATSVPASAAAAAPAVINAPAVEPTTAATKADAGKRPNARSRPEKAPAKLPPPDPPPPPQAVAVAPPPPPPVVREAPRLDRWQLMSDAIARCPRDDISGRVSCDQRLRAQYCEGHWGEVPHCASIPYTDHGQ